MNILPLQKLYKDHNTLLDI